MGRWLAAALLLKGWSTASHHLGACLKRKHLRGSRNPSQHADKVTQGMEAHESGKGCNPASEWTSRASDLEGDSRGPSRAGHKPTCW